MLSITWFIKFIFTAMVLILQIVAGILTARIIEWVIIAAIKTLRR